jgi:hypothetical protein
MMGSSHFELEVQELNQVPSELGSPIAKARNKAKKHRKRFGRSV